MSTTFIGHAEIAERANEATRKLLDERLARVERLRARLASEALQSTPLRDVWERSAGARIDRDAHVLSTETLELRIERGSVDFGHVATFSLDVFAGKSGGLSEHTNCDVYPPDPSDELVLSGEAQDDFNERLLDTINAALVRHGHYLSRLP